MIEIEQFIAGQYERDLTGYSYFVPTYINDEWTWKDPTINRLLEQAALRLGELNSYAQLVPNIDLFIQLHVTKEAVISSRIEGTQTQINEAFLNEADIIPERRDDWKEVKNYIKALNNATNQLEQIPISTRLLKETHRILMDGVRGESKYPGEFRRSQNWIGGASLLDATFIPPHHQLVPELMSDLEKFLHNNELLVPELIKIGIAHYQFETIHPFLDGNGRIGRLLITLYLVDKKILQKPLLYLSSFFEKNKGLYYDNLSFVRSRNDMLQWIKYFLTGIAQTAGDAVQTLSEVINLKVEIENNINALFGKRSAHANRLLCHLFKKPVIQVKEAKKLLSVSYKAANDLVNEFVEHGILKESSGQNRNRIFVFEQYLKLFEK